MLAAVRVSTDLRDQQQQSREQSRPIFDELRFVRFSDSWQESTRVSRLNGDPAFAGRVFVRFEMKGARHTWIDFTFRGHELSPQGAEAFRFMLGSLHSVSIADLTSCSEILGSFLGRKENDVLVHRIDAAEVGNVQGHAVLAVQWRLAGDTPMRGISVFIDAMRDGSTVHEIHFFTPEQFYDESVKRFNETMRSAQWVHQLPPPMCSVA